VNIRQYIYVPVFANPCVHKCTHKCAHKCTYTYITRVFRCVAEILIIFKILNKFFLKDTLIFLTPGF